MPLGESNGIPLIPQGQDTGEFDAALNIALGYTVTPGRQTAQGNESGRQRLRRV